MRDSTLRTRQQAHAGAGFSADWLRQREPFDARARAASALRLRLDERLARLRPSSHAPWRIIDLACGTGANLRWLAPRLGGWQQWLVVDHDAALLRCWPAWLAANAPRARSGQPHASSRYDATSAAPWRWQGPGVHCEIVPRQLDLVRHLDELPWQSAHLVTASALLDLVSADWLQRLVAAVATRRLALLIALSVDERHLWSPRDADDDWIAGLFAAHQQRDKGFAGPALGAAAVPALRQALRRAGYQVFKARSDWRLDGKHDRPARALQQAMIEGIAAASEDQQPPDAPRVRAWCERRLTLAARSTLRVGHIDLFALPRC